MSLRWRRCASACFRCSAARFWTTCSTWAIAIATCICRPTPGGAAVHAPLPAARICQRSAGAEAQPQFDLSVRERAPDPRPPAAARDFGRVSQPDAAGVLSLRAVVSGLRRGRSRRQRASFQDRSALPARIGGARFRPRYDSRHADGAAAGVEYSRADASAAGGRAAVFGVQPAHREHELPFCQRAPRGGRYRGSHDRGTLPEFVSAPRPVSPRAAIRLCRPASAKRTEARGARYPRTAVPRTLSFPSPKVWTRSTTCGRSARSTTASSSPRAATGYGSSTSTSRMSGFCSNKCWPSAPAARTESQRLLVPLVIGLSAGAADRIRAHRRGAGRPGIRDRAVRQPHRRGESRPRPACPRRHRKGAVRNSGDFRAGAAPSLARRRSPRRWRHPSPAAPPSRSTCAWSRPKSTGCCEPWRRLPAR